MNATLRAFLIVVSLLALLLLGILGLGSSFLPLLTAFFLAYLIYPIIQKLEKKGISRNHSLISLFVLCSVVSLIILAIILPKLVQQSQSFISELPQTVNTLAIKISESANSLGISLSLDKEGVSDTINDFAQSLSAGSIKQISTTLKGVFTNLSDLFLGLLNLFMIPLFLFYVTNDYEKIVTNLKRLIPQSIAPKLNQYWSLGNTVLSGYVRGQILVALLLSVLYAAGLSLVGLKFGFVIGLIAGLLSIIPYVGFTLGFLTSLGVALANSESLGTYIGIVIVFTIVQALEGFVITPKLVGNKVGLSAFATLLALIVGGNLLGLPGMLIAIPTAALLKVILGDLIHEYQKVTATT